MGAIQKENASRDLHSVLFTLYKKRLNRYMNDLRNTVLKDNLAYGKIRNLFAHFGDNANLRTYWFKWAQQTRKA